MPILVLFFCLIIAPLYGQPLQVHVDTESALLLNPETGKVLYEKKASKEWYPASLVKIATALLAIEKGEGNLDKKVIASKNALLALPPAEKRRNNCAYYPSYYLESDASLAGLKINEELTVRDLLHGTLLVSGGDASNVLAEHFGGGSIDRFMKEVNARLIQIGCTSSHFVNPSGIHHPDQVTCAQDVAKLFFHAMHNPLFRSIVRTVKYERKGKSSFVQTNRLLRKGPHFYPWAIGGKTGYYSLARYNLVAAAEKDGRLLIGVILGAEDSKSRFNAMRKLFDAAFRQKKVQKEVLSQGSQAFSRAFEGGNKPLKTYLKEKITFSFYPAEEPQLRCFLHWDEKELPIQKGEGVGHVALYADGRFIQKVPLYAEMDIERTLYSKIILFFSWEVCLLLALLPLVAVLFLVFLRWRKSEMS